MGPYEIRGPLGAGGMGEVYRARDTKLGREVAIKVIPEMFLSDADRMARFTREAQVLASLNHPNIAAIYGVEEGALVMELVEGSTLAERIGQGPIALSEALPLARQIAEALEYAHEHGVVHRDLKPANIKITPEGRVKVLDFGLAKALGNDPASGDPASSPTLTMRATMAGMILGTAAYMSPEQAKGKPVDRRADIWAFGVVLVEMLSGRQLYTGETASETMAAVMMKEPDLGGVPAAVPATIRRLLRRCLDKDPQRRLRDIGEARIALEDALAGAADPEPSSAPRSGSRWWMVAVAALALALLALAAIHFREAPPEPAAVRFQILPPEKGSFGTGGMALSPDGRRLAFVATHADGRTSLWVRALDSPTAVALPGTTGAMYPFWSPDSRSLGFFVVGKLKKVEASGGPAQTVCDVSNTGVGGSWSRDGVILFGTNTSGLFHVPQAGGAAIPLTTPDPSREENYHARPWFLPDAQHFLYCARSRQPEHDAIYLATLGAKDRKRLVGARHGAAFAPPAPGAGKAHLLFLRESTLIAQPLDPISLDFAGEAFPVAEQVGYDISLGYFSVSANGVLAVRSGGSGGNAQLAWFGRDGKPAGVVGPPGIYLDVALSPDGKRVAASKTDTQSGNRDIWLLDVLHGIPTRFTFDPALDFRPVWSPNGGRLVFTSNRTGPFNLYQKDSGGARSEEPLLKSDREQRSYDWSTDGRFLLYSVNDPKTKTDLWALQDAGGVSADRKAQPYLATQHNETQGQFSPSGSGAPRWVAYTSDESGRYEVYVQPFPAASGKFQISSDGGSQPRWRRDGKELYYLAPDGKLMAVETRTSPGFEHGAPKALFETRTGNRGAGNQTLMLYDVAADGKRFLINSYMEETASSPINVVLNWQAALKR
jgi:Tol biopolymer transport system component